MFYLLVDCLINEQVPLDLFGQLQDRLQKYLLNHQDIPECFDDDEVLAATIESLNIEGDLKDEKDALKINLFKYPVEPERKLELDSYYTMESFPNPRYLDLWTSLHFEGGLKEQLFSYICAIFRFATCGLMESPHISFNRMLLLHGQPGTGKQSCKRPIITHSA